MAKALEAERLAIEVHRPAYEAAFAAKPMPQVPGIETFVVNWRSLSPRHQKQVALSVAPWKTYIPVLVESGSTYYIKPLYELLSETPGQELLRDQRISYDSRLWDDVRGCGGYNTVTGVEDVERTILDRYNTVLHELTHQVHGVLTPAHKREIQELYRRTKERDETTHDAFLSRYAGGSVWEYFAEGANALESPRRDPYDTRDIVLERLETRDPALLGLVQALMGATDLDSCYAVGYANRGDDELTRGHADQAIASYRLALQRTPAEESATASLIYALDVAGGAGDALALAEQAAPVNPASAALALRHASALWHAGRGLDAAIAALRAARPQVRVDERYLVDLELGRLHWIRGDAAESRNAYAAVLEYQRDNPEGLWGTAAALALDQDWTIAWSRYEEAVRLRTGVVELRADFGRDLLRAGETARAREQVEAALLLDAEDPTVLSLLGWVQLAEGDPQGAAASASRALELGPWCDLARIVGARAHQAMGEAGAGQAARAAELLAPLRARIADGAAPEYVYRPKWGRYDEVHALPAVERSMLAEGK
jgi:tetratricopeptide (TPR) repeat protein